ncbi:N-6 DNA methylase [Nonomuraea rosea]|uniref:N-6 DNA methylase n=1 Tax=Nonomuraea rosea TaxID=638574 RepID=A0ABP6WDN4_9ACTN
MTEQPRWRISFAEIAALAGVKRPVVTTWARRHADFPEPVARDNGRPLFDGEHVASWLLLTGHGNTDARRLRAELALHTLTAWRDRLPAAVLAGGLTSLLCLRAQTDATLGGSDWPSLVRQAARVDFDDSYLLSELRALPEGSVALAALADALAEAAYSPAEAFEWVMERCRPLGAAELIADEPLPLVSKAMVQLSGVDQLSPGSLIAVPYARSGGLLAAFHEHAADHTLLAADPDPAFARLARRRLFTAGRTDLDSEVTESKTLDTADWGAPDLLVCALPYEPGETRDPVAILRRVQDLIDHLGPRQTAVVLGPADVLIGELASHGEADLIRRSLLTDNLLKASVALPDGVFPYRPAYRTALWVLSRTPEQEWTGLALLSDLSARPLTPQTLEALVADVQIFREAGWRPDPRHAVRQGAIFSVGSLDKYPGAALTPRGRALETRYTREVTERPALISELEIHFSQLLERAVHETGTVHTHAVLRPEEQTVRRTTVGRMLQERRLRRLPGHRIDAAHITAEGEHIILTPAEVLGAASPGLRRIDRFMFASTYEHAALTQPGDVVVTASPDLGAYVDKDGLSVVVYPARILRVRQDTERPVRPRVLAALLRAAAVGHRRVDGTVRTSKQIEDLVIPELTPDEALKYDTLLAEIDRRGALLRAQTSALDELARLTAAGLADGTLTLS